MSTAENPQLDPGGKNAGKQPAPQAPLTPDPTPEPDALRNAADQERQAAEQRRAEVINQVKSSKNSHNVLGIKKREEYETENAYGIALRNAFINLAREIHPRKTSDADAKDSYEKLKKAAKTRGLWPAAFEVMDKWDGIWRESIYQEANPSAATADDNDMDEAPPPSKELPAGPTQSQEKAVAPASQSSTEVVIPEDQLSWPSGIDTLQQYILQLWAKKSRPVHEMSDGSGTIISFREIHKEEEVRGHEFYVLTNEDPYLVTKVSSELDEDDRDQFLALENKHQIITDPGDPKAPPAITYRDKKNYGRLLGLFMKARKTNARGKPRAWETRALFLWKDGNFGFVPRSKLAVLTKKSKAQMSSYHKAYEIVPPEKRDPTEQVNVDPKSDLGQEILRARRADSTPRVGNLTPGDSSTGGASLGKVSGGTSTGSSKEIKSLQDSIGNLEQRFEKVETTWDRRLEQMNAIVEQQSAQMKELMELFKSVKQPASQQTSSASNS